MLLDRPPTGCGARGRRKSTLRRSGCAAFYDLMRTSVESLHWKRFPDLRDARLLTDGWQQVYSTSVRKIYRLHRAYIGTIAALSLI